MVSALRSACTVIAYSGRANAIRCDSARLVVPHASNDSASVRLAVASGGNGPNDRSRWSTASALDDDDASRADRFIALWHAVSEPGNSLPLNRGAQRESA